MESFGSYYGDKDETLSCFYGNWLLAVGKGYVVGYSIVQSLLSELRDVLLLPVI